MTLAKSERWRRRFLAAAFIAVAAIAVSAAESAPRKRVLVELFTSQGCASCPRANAFLGQLSHEPDTIALTYAVGYWDYLGWKDTFARPEFAERQKSYAAHFKRGVYTPQMVVDGEAHTNGLKPQALRNMFDEVKMLGGVWVKARREAGKAQIAVSGQALNEPADIWLVQYIPGPLYVEVKRGENAGTRMPHYNVVNQITLLGAWSGGAAKQFEAACDPACAVIVQEKNAGHVLNAKIVLDQPPQGPAPAGG